MRYFIDRSLGSRQLPALLRDAGWVVESMDERYGTGRSQSVPDTTWIQDLNDDEIALTSDKKIGKVPLQAEAIHRSSARIIVIDANMTGRAQGERLIAAQQAIERLAAGRPGPWVISAGMSSLRELRTYAG